MLGINGGIIHWMGLFKIFGNKSVPLKIGGWQAILGRNV